MAPIEIDGWHHLDPLVKKLWRIEAFISGGVLFLLALGVGFILNEAIEPESFHFGWIGAGFGVGLLAWILYVVGRRYEFWRYLVGEDDLSVAHGIWWRTRIYVPRARIQHVDVTAGPIARSLGLAVVSVFVSGHHGAVATIPGLREDVADALKRQLLARLEAGAPPVIEPEPFGG